MVYMFLCTNASNNPQNPVNQKMNVSEWQNSAVIVIQWS